MKRSKFTYNAINLEKRKQSCIVCVSDKHQTRANKINYSLNNALSRRTNKTFLLSPTSIVFSFFNSKQVIR
jgi:hypothetical protein